MKARAKLSNIIWFGTARLIHNSHDKGGQEKEKMLEALLLVTDFHVECTSFFAWWYTVF